MQIHVSGRKIDIGNALKTHVESALEAIVEKYFSRSLEASVTISKNAHLFIVDCALHVRQGIHLQSHGEAEDAHAAFDLAAEKIEKQLRRHKRRLKDHHASSRAGQEEKELIAQAYILRPDEDRAAEGEETTAINGVDSQAMDDQPVIVAETRKEIPHVSVGDAVMLMDLSDSPALMFRNRRNGQLNVVYRRPDGNIGWIDPAEQTHTKKMRGQ